jgi:hypothetical protein
MKILESVKKIGPNTFHAAYMAGKDTNFSEGDEATIITTIGYQLGETKFKTLRNKVLKQAPSNNELDFILKKLQTNKFKINIPEIKEEVEGGRIKPTPLIQKLIKSA